MTTDLTKPSPELEQGQHVEVSKAKVYINRTAENTNGGTGEPTASADREACVSVLKDPHGRSE